MLSGCLDPCSQFAVRCVKMQMIAASREICRLWEMHQVKNMRKEHLFLIDKLPSVKDFDL